MSSVLSHKIFGRCSSLTKAAPKQSAPIAIEAINKTEVAIAIRIPSDMTFSL
jgi:hypothetical protein